MSVRFKVILIMLISVVFIVSIGTGVTFFFMQKKLYGSIRADLKFLAGACETLVSKEINSLRKNADLISASIIRDNILDREQEDIASYLSHASDSSDFTALSLLSKTKLIADSGNNAKKGTPAGIECLNTPYANAAFMGNTVLSTLTKDKNGNLVFYVFSPVGNDRIIAGTIPASYLNSLIESFRFISNGEIYVLDETGRIVASRDRGLVGVNYVSSMGYETDPRKLALGGIFKQMIGEHSVLRDY
ncbi:hypothetical protein FACS1894188_08530 [Clostridia bacterium]|nr:hypothetical protein FACS1894188_08530 [Clostridia bacterium]